MSTLPSILITGCSSGIGLATAISLHAKGYQVLATARRAEDVKQLSSRGLNSHQLDVTDPESIRHALLWAVDQTQGKIDALFNNAGFGQPGAVEDLPLRALREQFETNLFGLHELTRQILPLMRAQGHGRIIQNSSVLGLVCMPYRGAYNASKFALEALSDTLRLELKGSNIFVSLIEPGPIESRFRANALTRFKEQIDIDQSAHFDAYQQQLERLGKETISNAFTLPASAVVKRVERILQSSSPSARYYVTTPTYLFAALKRILPTSWLDKLLIKG